MKDDRVYLRNILECIRRVEEDTAGGKDAFLSSHTLQDAVLRGNRGSNLHISHSVFSARVACCMGSFR
jgi:hypothetical protein